MRLESSIEAEIIKNLKKRKKSDTYKHVPVPAGQPDIEHLEKGTRFCFEVKRDKDHEASPIQKYRHQQLRKAGAIVKVVWSWDQVLKTLNKTLNKL